MGKIICERNGSATLLTRLRGHPEGFLRSSHLLVDDVVRILSTGADCGVHSVPNTLKHQIDVLQLKPLPACPPKLLINVNFEPPLIFFPRQVLPVPSPDFAAFRPLPQGDLPITAPVLHGVCFLLR